MINYSCIMYVYKQVLKLLIQPIHDHKKPTLKIHSILSLNQYDYTDEDSIISDLLII